MVSKCVPFSVISCSELVCPNLFPLIAIFNGAVWVVPHVTTVPKPVRANRLGARADRPRYAIAWGDFRWEFSLFDERLKKAGPRADFCGCMKCIESKCNCPRRHAMSDPPRRVLNVVHT
ncbi:hypothetical protein AAG570_010886 [Ranatra chinensis]|uniref:Uncharacterized protein n=1 Tax=Ranatra chinensis TaxID=642074 RepID=A0ABD0YJ05_9HEMI